jgi:hypothetical protein
MSRKRRIPFGVLKDGLPIRVLGYPPSTGGASAGIQYQIEAGIVPEYEVREAAVYAHIPWPAFLEMPPREKTAVVAQYRLHGLVDAWQQHAARQAAEAAARAR